MQLNKSQHSKHNISTTLIMLLIIIPYLFSVVLCYDKGPKAVAIKTDEHDIGK